MTDANVFLGYIPTGPARLGRPHRSGPTSPRSRSAGSPSPLELTLPEAAAGVHAIANARMTRALRSVSSEKGRDPRDFALIAYGGSGPVHAAGLAEELGCRTVLVPALAGLFSSLGLLFARPEFHDVHPCHLDARAVDPAEIQGIFDELRARVAPSLGPEAEWVESAELRYGGQTWEVEVNRGRRPPRRCVARRSDRALRGRARAAVRRPRRGRLADRDPGPPPRGPRPLGRGRGSRARRREAGGRRDADRLVRRRACRGARADASLDRRAPEPGPLLVDEYDTTVVVRPGWSVRRDEATETLVLERE